MSASQRQAAPIGFLPWNGDVSRILAPNPGWGSMKYWQPPILSAPIVKVPGLDDVKPITLSALTVEAKISGLLAKTTVYMSFFNPHERTLEGELEFPLPEGATVSGYGLDVEEDGKLQIVEATLVEKKKARQVFEAEVRKGVDPGLVEMTRGNMFNTRVYPLRPNDYRYIKLEYVSELTAHSDGKLYYFHPINVKNEVDFNLNVEVIVSGTDEAPAFATEELSGITLNKSEVGAGTFSYGISIQEKGWNFQASTSSLAVVVPRPENTTPVVYVEESNQPDEMEQFYFVVQDFVPAMKLASDAKPAKRIAVFWDASLSRATTDKTKELEVLERVVTEKLEKKGHVDLFIFRNVLEPVVTFDASDSKKLIEHLRTLPYDGATRLDTLSTASSKASKDIGFVLLFTDGMGSIGGDSCSLISEPIAPVHVITGTSRTTNHSLLKHYAFSTGGLFFDLGRFAADHVLSAVGKPSFTFVSASGDNLEHVLPATVTPVAVSAEHGSYFTVSGRLNKPGKSTLTVQYGYSKNEILHTSTHTIDSSAATGTGLVGLAWAQQALSAMSAQADKYAAEIMELGQRFKIVTPNTSLIVLESLEQHLEHDIEPAQSRKAMWESYHAHKESQKREKVQQEEGKLSRVRSWWEGRVKWWKTDFAPVEKQEKERAMKKMRRSEEQSLAAPLAMRSLSAAAPRMREMADEDLCPPPMAMMDECDDECEMEADCSAPVASSSAPSGGGISGVGVKVTAWDPQTPYIAKLSAAPRDLDAIYKVYLEQRDAVEESYATSPAFFFDCAHYFMNRADLDSVKAKLLGLRILTNIPELKLDEPQLLRMLGYKLDEMNQIDLAIEVFEKVLKLRPDEPQSHRDLALVLEKMGSKHYQRAVDLLWAVVVGPNWRDDFEEVEITALVEMNALIAKAEREKVKLTLPERSGPFIQNLDCDLRISMGWDTDETDFDLHVVEPNGEECYFASNRTRAGGLVSRDFRHGYGPEEYMIKRAYPGEFRAWTNYFAMHTATLTGPSSIILKIFVNWGRPNQEEHVTLTRLQESRSNADLGRITIPDRKIFEKVPAKTPVPSITPVTEVHSTTATLGSALASAHGEPASSAPKSPRSDGDKSKCLVM